MRRFRPFSAAVARAGVGKSALALVAAHYVIERHYFADGAVHVDLSQPAAADFLPSQLSPAPADGAAGGEARGGGAACVFDCVCALTNSVLLSQTLPDRAVAAAAEVRTLLRELRARTLAEASAAAAAAAAVAAAGCASAPSTPSAAGDAPAQPPPPWASPHAGAAAVQTPPPAGALGRTPATPSTGGSAAAHAAGAAHAASLYAAAAAIAATTGSVAQPPPAATAAVVAAAASAAAASGALAHACEEASSAALALLVERLLGALSAAHCLLVLDNVSLQLRADGQLSRLFSALLRCRRVRLLCTCEQPLGLALPGVSEKVVRLEPLDAQTTARLVVRAAPRPLLRSELERTLRRLHAESAGGAAAGASMLQCLAQHELVTQVIRGLPSVLFQLVPLLHDLSLDQLAQQQLGARAGAATAEGGAASAAGAAGAAERQACWQNGSGHGDDCTNA